jgi:hypothetical protein
MKGMVEDGQLGVAPQGRKKERDVPVSAKKLLWKEVSCGLLDDNRASCGF